MISNHLKFINLAHDVAQKNLGKTFPNPTVGCIISKKNKIISKSVTSSTGRPHAEEIALKKAGLKAKGATMYVTLEPCFHSSQNGSCTDQILRSGIKEIYISCIDPDPRTKNKSINKLKRNKIKVITGLEKEKTIDVNNFFFKSLKKKKPFTKVKMAISNDDKIAWSNYKSKWISNSKSRSYSHSLRLKSQAILTTSKTILKDNPRFTVRKKNRIIKNLNIVIIDKNLNIPLNTKILKNLHERRVIIFTSKKNSKSQKLKQLGCEIIEMKIEKNKLNLKKIFSQLYKLKISDLLVEAGGILFAELIKNALVDELHLFRAPIVIGKKGIPVIKGNNLKNINKKLEEQIKFDDNLYSKYSIK
ncbi:bifunctional diaminohydroxyphosphoribosylaminopyrimidine deaminase/5-amino-6-(5-phosphoribosylamino)uracil reductase RibD [bacterium]|nr:bifunctional diaminohydroxyphosphoribosylaminopyrimidine deaminase/5-amino-6-(5-phosphoribosylamino)uracil reductase RibD [bacterium]